MPKRFIAANQGYDQRIVTRQGLWATILCAAVIFGSVMPTYASRANLGTLKCILDPATKEPFGVERQLSCTFSPIIGPQADLVGVIKKIGVETPGQERIILIWSVVGPGDEFSADKLQGRYIGSLVAGEDGNSPGLIGGLNSDIALKPLTDDPNAAGNAATSILELDLAAMKA